MTLFFPFDAHTVFGGPPASSCRRTQPFPSPELTNSLLPGTRSGVAMLQSNSVGQAIRHSSAPLSSVTAMSPAALKKIACLTPPTSATTGDAYAALSLPVFQTTSPVFLSKAATPAFFAPGMTRSRSPAITGDADTPHWLFLAPNSLSRSICQTIAPVLAARHFIGPDAACT